MFFRFRSAEIRAGGHRNSSCCRKKTNCNLKSLNELTLLVGLLLGQFNEPGSFIRPSALQRVLDESLDLLGRTVLSRLSHFGVFQIGFVSRSQEDDQTHTVKTFMTRQDDELGTS